MSCHLLDLTCHLQGAFWGVVNAVPWWVWLVAALAGLGVAYKLGGWPAVAALAFGYGLFWGRKSVSTDDQYAHPDPRAPKVKPPRKKRPTIFDGLRK